MLCILKYTAKAVVGKGLEKGKKMSGKPVYLADVPSNMTLEEVPKEILVENPKGRELVIKPKESGWEKKQVFTSECLPDEIPYKLLGLVKFPGESVYPKYIADVLTDKELWLGGRAGYENGINIIDNIAWWLTYQEKMLEAKSIKRSDLEFFDYKKEKLAYWLASPGFYGNVRNAYFGPGIVDYGGVYCGNFNQFISDEDLNASKFAVRSVMILEAKVEFEPITWVSL